jgi:hypothetical protein
MIGREERELNDLFFVCSLIEYIARRTKNKRTVIVNALGKAELQHLYDLADVYHSENIDKLTDGLITKYHIRKGSYDNVTACRYHVPSHWDIGKVYKRLIANVAQDEHKSAVDALIEVYNSWITNSIDDYNSSMYYENPDYLYASYKERKPL